MMGFPGEGTAGRKCGGCRGVLRIPALEGLGSGDSWGNTFERRSEDLDATLENLRLASASIAKTLGNVDNTLAGADRALASADKALASVDNVVVQVNTAVASADMTMQKIGLLSDDTRKVVNGQGVAQLTQVLAQTRALIASLTRISQDLEREPSKLIYGD